jgi:rubrerythrin
MASAESYETLNQLRYVEVQTARLLREIVAHEAAPSKEVGSVLCRAYDDHERHARELDAVLKEAGERGRPLPERFKAPFDERLHDVGQAEGSGELVERLTGLETYQTRLYEQAVRRVGPELKGLIGRQLAEERRHAAALRHGRPL